MDNQEMLIHLYNEAKKGPVELEGVFQDKPWQFDENAVQDLVSFYKGEDFDAAYSYAEGAINSLVLLNEEKANFYSKLYEVIFNSAILCNERQKQSCFIVAAFNPNLPYEHFDVISMSDDEYLDRRKDNIDKIEKINRYSLRQFSQKTQCASVLLEVIESGKSREDKAILLAAVLDAFRSSDSDV